MDKHIILCSDGTRRGTNAATLCEAIDLNGHRANPGLPPQVAFCGGVERGNAFGLARHVRRLYRELARVYDAGDRLFFFGVGRGASAIRTLVDFVACCGIVDVQRVPTAGRFDRLVDDAWAVYRQGHGARLHARFGRPLDPDACRRFRETHARPGDVSIAFVGVWDSVDATRLPVYAGTFLDGVLHRVGFPDRHLSPSVERAAQALAIDDARDARPPRLWHLRQGDARRIEQVWFAGAHANFGGSAGGAGLSPVALEWIMQRAEAAGLRLSATAHRGERVNVDGALDRPRPFQWCRPRDVEALCRQHEVEPTIHVSVLERIAHGPDGYAPGNLPPGSRVVITHSGDAERDALANERARGVEEVLHQAHAARQSLLRRVETELWVGHVSCTVRFVALALALLAAFTWGAAAGVAVLVAGLLVARGLYTWAERRMQQAFSSFWYGVRGELRRALRRARHVAARRHAPASVSACVVGD